MWALLHILITALRDEISPGEIFSLVDMMSLRLYICLLSVATDINECEESHQSICSNGRCENIPGGYRCICNRGYELSPDKSFCLGKL